MQPSWKQPTAAEAIRMLQRSHLMEAPVVSLLLDLRGLRNQAAHVPEFAPSSEAVIEYAEMAELLASQLSAATIGA